MLRFNKNSSTLVLICDNIINADLRSRYFILFKSYNRYYKKTRTSHPEVFLGKGVLKICSKFLGEHPCRSIDGSGRLLVQNVIAFMYQACEQHGFTFIGNSAVIYRIYGMMMSIYSKVAHERVRTHEKALLRSRFSWESSSSWWEGSSNRL